MDDHPISTTRDMPLRARVTLGAFDLLYRSEVLYWIASTIPFAGQWRTWQHLVLSRLQGRDILEVGCGPGWLLGDMVAAGYHCQAIDASPQMVAAARRNLARRRLIGGTVTQAQVQTLPFPEAQFDTVVSTFPTPYIADGASLREIVRVLRPGGRLIILEGAHLLPKGPLLGLLTQIQRLVYGRVDTQTPDSAAYLAALRRRIPLDAAGLTPEVEIVTGPFWRAFIAYGVKPGSYMDHSTSMWR